MIALGIFVETESPAAQKNLMDSWTRNDKKTMLDMMLQSDYQMTSFGKCFAQFISEDLFNEICDIIDDHDLANMRELKNFVKYLFYKYLLISIQGDYNLEIFHHIPRHILS